jgi:predicted RNA-binding protein with RPS1 domain
MAPLEPSEFSSGDVQYRCIITQVAPYGIHVDVPDLNSKGLLRITELLNPAILKDQTCVGSEIVARVIGKEKVDEPLILSQRPYQR